MRYAILAAAANIERGGRMNFYKGIIPDSADGVACPLAWIGFYAGYSRVCDHGVVARDLGCYPMGFYDALALLLGTNASDWDAWRENDQACAKALRLYADKHYPEVA